MVTKAVAKPSIRQGAAASAATKALNLPRVVYTSYAARDPNRPLVPWPRPFPRRAPANKCVPAALPLRLAVQIVGLLVGQGAFENRWPGCLPCPQFLPPPQHKDDHHLPKLLQRR